MTEPRARPILHHLRVGRANAGEAVSGNARALTVGLGRQTQRDFQRTHRVKRETMSMRESLNGAGRA
jgi:hypothetical protein